jgi:hypothetical protein
MDKKHIWKRRSIDITVAIGSVRELMSSEILYIGSTDYFVGGNDDVGKQTNSLTLTG